MIPMRPIELATNSQNQVEKDIGVVLVDLSMQELTLYCTREVKNFRQTGETDDRYALEVFHRAVLGATERIRNEAWDLIFELFSPLVLSWMNRLPGARRLMHEMGSEISLSLLNAIFAKVSLTFQRQTDKITRFTTLRAILSYMKRVTHSVVSDEIHLQSPYYGTSDLEEASALWVEDPVSEIVQNEQVRLFWRIIEEETFDQELLYLKLSFIHGMKPAEIVATHPGAFSRVDEVYQVRRTVLARLRQKLSIGSMRKFQQELQSVE